eukprot:7383012-Prymnesium_polylepis.1
MHQLSIRPCASSITVSSSHAPSRHAACGASRIPWPSLVCYGGEPRCGLSTTRAAAFCNAARSSGVRVNARKMLPHLVPCAEVQISPRKFHSFGVDGRFHSFFHSAAGTWTRRQPADSNLLVHHMADR